MLSMGQYQALCVHICLWSISRFLFHRRSSESTTARHLLQYMKHLRLWIAAQSSCFHAKEPVNHFRALEDRKSPQHFYLRKHCPKQSLQSSAKKSVKWFLQQSAFVHSWGLRGDTQVLNPSIVTAWIQWRLSGLNMLSVGVHSAPFGSRPVSYTHLTLPTKRIV